MKTSIVRVSPADSHDIAVMAGELLEEIMDAIQSRAFHFALDEAAVELAQFLAEGKYFALAAIDKESGSAAGFVTLHESYAIYAAGAFGTIPELYVRPAFRGRQVGKALLDAARQLGQDRGWTRLEVTTPPLPQFQRTLAFYEREGLVVSGGRKLQVPLARS